MVRTSLRCEGSGPRHDIATTDMLLLVALLVPVLSWLLGGVLWTIKEFAIGLFIGLGARASGVFNPFRRSDQ
jgi:hypothetical protein